jgi:F-type H+-transporting ATPase subunit delta
MIPGSLARRYARALVGLAQSPIQRDKFARDLQAFAEVVRSPDVNGRPVLDTLAQRRFTLADRKRLVEALAGKVGADPMVVKFLQHVLERDRIVGVPDIARAYVRMADEAAGRLQAELASAAPLPADAVARITQALERATGKKIVMTTRVDSELVGGIVAKVGSWVVDGSVRASLAQMKQALREGGAQTPASRVPTLSGS